MSPDTTPTLAATIRVGERITIKGFAFVVTHVDGDAVRLQPVGIATQPAHDAAVDALRDWLAGRTDVNTIEFTPAEQVKMIHFGRDLEVHGLEVAMWKLGESDER